MAELNMELEDIAAYLQHTLDRPDLEARALTRFPRGVSRETWFVETEYPEDGKTGQQGYVIRRDLPGRSICTSSLRFEYEIYHRLYDTNVPVARTLVYEDDLDWLIDGREFYIRELVEGRWDVPHFTDMDPKYDDARIEASKEHARKLAAIHTLDWSKLGFGKLMDVPQSPETAALTAIDRLQSKLKEFQIEPIPIFAEAVGWLRDNAPKTAPCISLLKGNNGLGEEIWHEGQIVAMSDWEPASLGDPAYDFAWCQGFTGVNVPDKWNLQSFLDYYEEVSGIHIEQTSIGYYRLIQALEGTVFSHNAALPIIDRENLLARLCWVSTEVHHSMQSGLARGMGII